MPNIKIVGEQQTREYDLVKDSVINLGNLWYYKHDKENLVKVLVGSGYRLYRKNSVLICKTLSGDYAKKSDCICISPDVYLLKNHPDTIKLDNGEFTHKSFAVFIHNKWYLKSDERVTKTQEGYFLKSEVVQLSERVYGKNKFYPNTPELTEIKGEYIFTQDVKKIVTFDKEKEQLIVTDICKIDISDRKYVNNVFYGFKDKSNPQLGRYEVGYADANHVMRNDEIDVYVLKDYNETLSSIVKELKATQYAKATEDARKKCNSKFSDVDANENVAKIIDPNYETWGGKQNLFGLQHSPIYSKKFKEIGGIGYTFGVEFETSAGVLPKAIANKMGVLAVGDRSIGAAEYVTGILQGDAGLDKVEAICKVLSEHCFVDDRCGIHVHVGSPNIEGATEWKINWNYRFAIASIKLGTILEEELFKTLPPSRNPYNKHCHSIMRYKDIDESNWRDHLGTFIFGPEENWGRPLDLSQYRYGEGSHKKENGLSTWCGGRYKWLNLVRCFSKCSSPTIEFRIWSPSTNFEKIKAFILLSLAFTYVVDNCYKEVMSGDLNLSKVIHLAYHDYPAIEKSLNNFISERKEKFNRKIIYNGIKPKEIVNTYSLSN